MYEGNSTSPLAHRTTHPVQCPAMLTLLSTTRSAGRKDSPLTVGRGERRP